MLNQRAPFRLETSTQLVKLDVPTGHSIVSTSVSLRGELLLLVVPDPLVKQIIVTRRDGVEGFPGTKTKSDYSGTVLQVSPWGTQETLLTGLNATFPHIQTLPNNEFLIVAPRCARYKDETHDLNGRLYGADGTLKGKFLLGDGIEHVQTDDSGSIWVGYFDEGVFGNYGWKTPIGTSGLCCFDKSGEKVWEYSPPSGCPYVVDCYALNVAKDGVWAYYYTDFPIVQIDSEKRARGWSTNIHGARTMAVCRNKVLLYGGYQEHRTDCQLVELGDGSARRLSTVTLGLPEEVNLNDATVIGRDSELHVIAGGYWYRFSLRDLDR